MNGLILVLSRVGHQLQDTSYSTPVTGHQFTGAYGCNDCAIGLIVRCHVTRACNSVVIIESSRIPVTGAYGCNDCAIGLIVRGHVTCACNSVVIKWCTGLRPLPHAIHHNIHRATQSKTHTYTDTHTHRYTHTHVHAHAHTPTHTHTHTHTHTYTHTDTQ